MRRGDERVIIIEGQIGVGKTTMGDEEFATYESLLDNMLEHIDPPDLLVYLDCTVDTAIERIRKRNRGLEADIPREYLERLNRRYLAWYADYELSPKIRVDTDAEPLDLPANAERVLERVRSALKDGRYGATIR